MGDLAFGKDFGMLSSGEEHFAVNLLHEGMQPFAMLFPTWFFRTLAAIPGLAAGYWKFVAYCSQQLDDRLNVRVVNFSVPLGLAFILRLKVGNELLYLTQDRWRKFLATRGASIARNFAIPISISSLCCAVLPC